MLVEFSIAHISCIVSCIELKLGTNDEEDITQLIVPLCLSMVGMIAPSCLKLRVEELTRKALMIHLLKMS